MKNFKVMMIALVAMFGFISCEEQDFVEVDYSKGLVGIWTILEADHAAAYIFSADGTVSTTGMDSEGFWDDVKGTYDVVNNKINLKFESGHNIDGSFDIIPGQTLSIVDKTGRHTYQYCKEDLSEEVVGLWVCTDGPTDADNDMMIRNFFYDGKTTFTGLLPIGDNPESVLDYEVNYNVVGDLVFLELPENSATKYSAERLMYAPNATGLGDIMTIYRYLPSGNELVSSNASFLRIKQTLDLPGKKYDYSKTFVSNVKGSDEEISIMGYSFSIAKMDGVIMDKMLKYLLFTVEFPDANTIKYQYHYNGNSLVFESPIAVDGNKVTIKMSELGEVYRDVDMYVFQDQDNTQMHMYMPTYAFINYFANMNVAALVGNGTIDKNDKAAVAAIFEKMDERVDSINLSFVMKAAK